MILLSFFLFIEGINSNLLLLLVVRLFKLQEQLGILVALRYQFKFFIGFTDLEKLFNAHIMVE